MRRSSPNPWQLLKQGVSLRTMLLAFVPIGIWIVFIFVFVFAVKAIVHVEGQAEIVVLVLRSMVELATATLAFKYFFDILARGVESEQSVDSKNRT
jgi:hypothetical protein